MKYTIQTKILTGFILGLMAIGLIGYVVHQQMTNLASSLYDANERQNNLVVYQKILTAISAAENSVKTYSITNDQKDLKLFHASEERINRYLALLQQNLNNNKDFKYLHKNLDYKLYVMQRMVELREQNPSENVINEAIDEIKHLPNTIANNNRSAPENFSSEENKLEQKNQEKEGRDVAETKNTVAEKEDKKDEKKGFFQRLFSRKKSDDKKEENTAEESEESNPNIKKEKPDHGEDNVVAENKSVEEQQENSNKENNGQEKALITESLKKLQQEKDLETDLWKDAMLVLIQEDSKIMEEIRKNISELEKHELDNNSQFIAAASRSRDQIIYNTKVVGIGAFSIIMLLSFIVFHDFKKIRKNRQSLIDEKERASRLASVKEKFLANMSHEIRTPMNAIIGFSELLEKTKLNKQQEDYLSTIQNSSKHLMVILNDILDYSKIESGKLTIKKEHFNVQKSIQQVVKAMTPEAEKKGISLKVDLNKNIESNLIGDSVRLQQVLYNLLSNAIKFTDKGSVYLRSMGIMREGKFFLFVEVKDDGIGIPQESIDRIFENFEQASTNRDRKHGGTGLGLAIVRKLISLQKGTISVESKVGEGSTFTVQIPYKVSNKKIKTKSRPAMKKSADVDYSNLSVLAVDDQEYNLELIKIILTKWGAKIDTADSGLKAFEKFKSNDYDLILMDVQMPEMSGLDATMAIRESSKKGAQKIPIIALTAASTKEETDKCLKAGMNGFLLKPFKQKELRQAIDKYLDKATKKDKPETAAKVNFDLGQLRLLSNGNNEFIINMLDVYVRNTNHDLKILEQYIKDKNWKSAGLQAHKMVAPSRHLGIKTLANLLEEIEKKGLHEQDVEEIPELVRETKSIALNATCQLVAEIKKINGDKLKQVS